MFNRFSASPEHTIRCSIIFPMAAGATHLRQHLIGESKPAKSMVTSCRIHLHGRRSSPQPPCSSFFKSDSDLLQMIGGRNPQISPPWQPSSSSMVA
ncbi:hypothetical protein ACLOJK_027412 [Asimina triloba]